MEEQQNQQQVDNNPVVKDLEMVTDIAKKAN